MATGDIIWFEEARTFGYFAGWAGTDDIKVAVLDNTTAPTAATATPALGDFTEVGAAGSYTAGGTSLGTWAAMNSESGGTGTVDSGTNPTWAQNASNDTDAHWGLIYNDTQSGDPAIAFVELGGPVDMSAGSLTITWNASGIATITAA
ncbi:hypothetical protein [uncultured Ruegeria sp.]|uniref:hypothetical protein n=1 Tax=uncultured Ruegeria sp. TaxID=259304 RepID=UPI0026196E37|nr:hypothetical protein [uncultured Ruegeria sp.]